MIRVQRIRMRRAMAGLAVSCAIASPFATGVPTAHAAEPVMADGVPVLQAAQPTTCAQVLAAAQAELAKAEATLASAKAEVGAAAAAKTEAQSSFNEASKAVTAQKSKVAAAQSALDAATKKAGPAAAQLAKADAAIAEANSATGIIHDVSFTGQTPLKVQVDGSTARPDNSTLVAVKGQYVTSQGEWDKQRLLNYINQVRREAYQEGLVTKYVPLQWSDALERTAQIRAAEISIYGDHTRPSGEKWHGLGNEGLQQPYGENLSWGANYYNLVKMWVDEKAEYIKYKQGKPADQWGHYSNLINMGFTQIGFAEFVTDRPTVNPYGTAMAAELAYNVSSAGSTDLAPSGVDVYQGVFVRNGSLSAIGADGATTFNPRAVPNGDPVFYRASAVHEAKALVKSMANAEKERIDSASGGAISAMKAAQAELDRATKELASVERTAAEAKSALDQATARTGKADSALNAATTAVSSAKGKVSAAQSCQVSSISISGPSTLEKGKTATLKAAVIPTDAKNPAVSWTTSNAKVATVSANGLVTAIGAGSATITATAKDGSGTRATRTITVAEPLVNVYRLYNRVSHEHLWTTDANEVATLTRGDWNDEGVAWKSPKSSSTPVYRLYNRISHEHIYTADRNEAETLSRGDWNNEGIVFYSDDSKRTPVYRQYNPQMTVGAHLYTTDLNEYNTNNTKNGWRGEGIAFYAATAK